MRDKTSGHKKVLLGMSGGLDSTMSALLLKKAGYTVIGLTLKTWHIDPQSQEETVCKARALAQKLEIEHHVSPVENVFKKEVVDYFCNEYLLGRTPNPCNRCNPLIKWPFLIKKAEELGCDHVATGHYVQKMWLNNRWFIKKGVDPAKDQSYFLWNLDQKILEKALFPLGQLTKKEVRELAINNGLQKTARQQESMGVCFLGGINYRDFLRNLELEGKLQINGGDIVDEDGLLKGKHPGIPYFTIGQRKGLETDDKNHFVTRMNAETNEVVVSKTASLETGSLLLSDYHLTQPLIEKEKIIVSIRIRGIDRIPEIPGKIQQMGNSLKVFFNHPAWAITPGQSIVFYQDDCVIGGGIVDDF